MLSVIKEKKVEYIELIYDLIFVYLIGRNNALIHITESGIIDAYSFLTFIICTLAVIQLWAHTTFYINRYGRNSARDTVFLCINMFLLYYMAEGTRVGWQTYYNQYNISWMLILINIGLQYAIEYRNHKNAPWELKQIRINMIIIFIQAAAVAVSVPLFHETGTTIALYAVAFGLISSGVIGRANRLVPVDFEHLTERFMLYVVFTFGEMIISIASYFQAGISIPNVYFAAMAFSVVVGLFLTYGLLYNKLIDRKRESTGTGYLLIHIFIIFALCNITAAFEIMRDEEALLFPKMLFLVFSFFMYFTFLFLLGFYAKDKFRPKRRFILHVSVMGVVFFILMMLTMDNMYINIAITVIYVFATFLLFKFVPFGRKVEKDVLSEKTES